MVLHSRLGQIEPEESACDQPYFCIYAGSMRKNPQVRKFLVPRLIAFKYQEREFRKRAMQAKRDQGFADDVELQQHPQMAHVPMRSVDHRPS